MPTHQIEAEEKAHWIEVEAKAREVKMAAVDVINFAHKINTGTVVKGRALHASTMASLKTEDIPEALGALQDAVNNLNEARMP